MSKLISKAFFDKLQAGQTPVRYIALSNDAGLRIYSDRKLGAQFEANFVLLDGSRLLDGSFTLGLGSNTITREPLLLKIGKVDRTLQTIAIARSKTVAKRQQKLIITLNDTDKLLSQRFSTEPILNKTLSLYKGFADLTSLDHLREFIGTITRIINKKDTITVEATEN